MVNKLEDIKEAFEQKPLDEKNMERYYCPEAMKLRTGDEYGSPLLDIYESCIRPGAAGVHLLTGHKGCGKSTELIRLKTMLQSQGHRTVMIRGVRELNLPDLAYWDIAVVLLDNLLSLACEAGCDVKPEWGSKIGNIKQELLCGGVNAILIREQVDSEMTEWVHRIHWIAGMITRKSQGKKPVVILDDLEKLSLDETCNVFRDSAALLSQIPFPIICTAPISLACDPRMVTLEAYYQIHDLQMIKVAEQNGSPYGPGVALLRKLIGMRASETLFEETALEMLILYSGGSLKDLFFLITCAASRAARRNSKQIECADGQFAVKELGSKMTRRMEEKSSDKIMLSELLQASVILECNHGKQRRVHPVIADLLKEQSLT